MFKYFLCGALCIASMLIGCAGQQSYRSTPPVQTVSTQHYEVTLEPIPAEGHSYYNQFRYTFINKSGGDLIINWSQTYYLQNGKRYGKFGWIGLTFEELRGLTAEPDITVAARQRTTALLFPLKLIGWREEAVRKKAATPEAGFTLGIIPAGDSGMSIAVIKDGKVLRKRILVTIAQE